MAFPLGLKRNLTKTYVATHVKNLGEVSIQKDNKLWKMYNDQTYHDLAGDSSLSQGLKIIGKSMDEHCLLKRSKWY